MVLKKSFSGVFITCHGKTHHDRNNLKGMRTDLVGIDNKFFPIKLQKDGGGRIEEKLDLKQNPIKLDLSKAKLVTQAANASISVMIHCQAWARNIDWKPTPPDEDRPQGGGAILLCFREGAIKKAKDRHC